MKDDDRMIPLLVYEETERYEAYYSLLESGERKLLSLKTSGGTEKCYQACLSGFPELRAD